MILMTWWLELGVFVVVWHCRDGSIGYFNQVHMLTVIFEGNHFGRLGTDLYWASKFKNAECRIPFFDEVISNETIHKGKLLALFNGSCAELIKYVQELWVWEGQLFAFEVDKCGVLALWLCHQSSWPSFSFWYHGEGMMLKRVLKFKAKLGHMTHSHRLLGDKERSIGSIESRSFKSIVNNLQLKNQLFWTCKPANLQMRCTRFTFDWGTSTRWLDLEIFGPWCSSPHGSVVTSQRAYCVWTQMWHDMLQSIKMISITSNHCFSIRDITCWPMGCDEGGEGEDRHHGLRVQRLEWLEAKDQKKSQGASNFHGTCSGEPWNGWKLEPVEV